MGPRRNGGRWQPFAAAGVIALAAFGADTYLDRADGPSNPTLAVPHAEPDVAAGTFKITGTLDGGPPLDTRGAVTVPAPVEVTDAAPPAGPRPFLRVGDRSGPHGELVWDARVPLAVRAGTVHARAARIDPAGGGLVVDAGSLSLAPGPVHLEGPLQRTDPAAPTPTQSDTTTAIGRDGAGAPMPTPPKPASPPRTSLAVTIVERAELELTKDVAVSGIGRLRLVPTEPVKVPLTGPVRLVGTLTVHDAEGTRDVTEIFVVDGALTVTVTVDGVTVSGTAAQVRFTGDR